MDFIKVTFVHNYGAVDLLVQVVPRVDEYVKLPNNETKFKVHYIDHLYTGTSLPKIIVYLTSAF